MSCLRWHSSCYQVSLLAALGFDAHSALEFRGFVGCRAQSPEVVFESGLLHEVASFQPKTCHLLAGLPGRIHNNESLVGCRAGAYSPRVSGCGAWVGA